MENQALYNFAKVVYDYCGLNYLHNLTTLHLKMAKHLKSLHITHYEDYLMYLNKHPEQWENIVELLTINETYFYREEKQFHTFCDKVYKPFIQKQNQPLKLWSAACSTGEEPYSLIMNTLQIDEKACERIEIIATDINQSVLQFASEAKYFHKSLAFRRIPSNWLEQYFEHEGLFVTVQPFIKEVVSFQHLNLLAFDQYPDDQSLDVIFCRNVLIYFDEQTIEKVVRGFYKALKKGGVLFLGHAEMISKLNIGFQTVNDNGTFYYRKE
jgi:chemotaxis protein methyltransferase CheR